MKIEAGKQRRGEEDEEEASGGGEDEREREVFKLVGQNTCVRASAGEGIGYLFRMARVCFRA
jgi:hypothetical protein